MIKCFVSGYWKSNLGDDLFLKIVCERYPHVKFYTFLDKKNSEQFKQYNNLTIIYNNFLFRIVNKLMRKMGMLQLQDILGPLLAKNFLEIGGSIFMQDKRWQYRLKQRNYARNQYSKYFIIGSNFGPFYDQEYEEKYKELFDSVDGISFRDSYSYNLFAEKNMTKASDVIFGLSTSEYKRQNKKKQVVISVVDNDSKNKDTSFNLQDKYESKIITTINKLTKEGYDVILMSFCKYEGDTDVINRIYSRLGNNNHVKTFEYFHDIESALKLIADSEKVIASRFHACVLGLLFGCKVLPIAYSDKMMNLIQDIYKEKKWLSIKEFVNSDINSENFIYLSENAAKLIGRDAENQFQFLDGFMKQIDF